MWNIQVLIYLTVLSAVNSAKILGIFPIPSKSHAILGSALLKELVLRGHEVIMISPYPLTEPIQNYKDIVLTDIIKLSEEKLKKSFNANSTIIDTLKMIFSVPNLCFGSIINDEEMVKFLNSNEKFHVIIQDWTLTEALIGIGYKLEAPTIGISVIGSNPFINYLFNVPTPYSYVPNLFLPYTDEMTFFQRVLNTIISFSVDVLYRFFAIPIQRNLLQEYFPNSPPLDDLIKNVDIILSCSHFSTETVRPTFVNIIPIGGLHLYEKQELSKELKYYLDNSKNGVVLFSFGTNIRPEYMPPGAEDILLNAFRKLPYNILWKTDSNFVDLPKNVKISKWLPQRAVLAHPNLKAFITHGGLGSAAEAIFNAVPMIGIPFVADQLKNVAECEHKGILLKIDVNQMSEENIIWATNEVINNPEYKKNMEYQSDLYKNREINPMDRAVFWVEHVIKHKGAKHLRSRATELPLYQYYLLDVITFLFIIFIILSFIIYSLFKYIFGRCCKKEKLKTL